jgi:hypothetical protein
MSYNSVNDPAPSVVRRLNITHIAERYRPRRHAIFSLDRSLIRRTNLRLRKTRIVTACGVLLQRRREVRALVASSSYARVIDCLLCGWSYNGLLLFV